jgi:hypothetical protein
VGHQHLCYKCQFGLMYFDQNNCITISKIASTLVMNLNVFGKYNVIHGICGLKSDCHRSSNAL